MTQEANQIIHLNETIKKLSAECLALDEAYMQEVKTCFSLRTQSHLLRQKLHELSEVNKKLDAERLEKEKPVGTQPPEKIDE